MKHYIPLVPPQKRIVGPYKPFATPESKKEIVGSTATLYTNLKRQHFLLPEM